MALRLGWRVLVAVVPLLLLSSRVGHADTGYQTPFGQRGAGTPLRLNAAGEALVVAADGSIRVFTASGTPIGPMPTLPGGSYVIATGLSDPLAPGQMGRVWGYGDTSGGEHAVVWDPLSGITDIGTLAGTSSSRVIGMDAEGWLFAVCGNTFESHPLSGATLGQRAFVCHPSQPDVRIEIAPPVTYDLIQLKDVGPSGKVQVSSWTADFAVSNTAYVWDRPSQSFTDLQYGGDVGNMNGAGEVVAGSLYWSPAGVTTDLHDLVPFVNVDTDNFGMVASLITDSGWVAGTAGSSNLLPTVFVVNLRDESAGHVPGAFDLSLEIESAGGVWADPFVLTESGQVVGRIWVQDQAGQVEHVFFWDDRHGLSDLTPELGFADGPVSIHSVSPTGKVVFATSTGLFSWQRVDGIGATTPLTGLVGEDGDVPPYYWVWNPTKLTNAVGQVFARDAAGNCFLATPSGATPAGATVQVQPDANTSITFGAITVPGETAVVSYDIDDPDAPTVPADFSLAGTDTLINISTTATFDGQVHLALHYDDTGMSAARESQIRLLHFEDPEWVDVTDYARSGGFLDTTNDIVYGVTTLLSPFAIAVRDYGFGGFESPVNADGSSIFKINKTVPLRFQLSEPDGTAITGARAELRLFKESSAVLGSVDEVEHEGDATTGNLFEAQSGGKYHFNLKTTGMSAGHYRADAVLDDGSTHSVKFSLR